MSRGALALLVAVAAVFSSGCSIRKLAINSLADAFASAEAAYASDSDPELIEAALPFSLKTIEALLEETPRNSGLLTAACSGFTQYAYAFVLARAEFLELDDYAESERQKERALAFALRGRDYCLRGLELEHEGITERLRVAPAAAAAEPDAKAIELLHWSGASWGLAISVGKHRPDIVADLPAVQALVSRVLEIQPSYREGEVHEVMIAVESVPEAMGGSPERAREHFEKAVELSGGQTAAPYVSLASGIVVAEQNRHEFVDLLEKALAIDVDRKPSKRLANVVAQRRARLLLERVDEYFFSEE